MLALMKLLSSVIGANKPPFLDHRLAYSSIVVLYESVQPWQFDAMLHE